MIPAAIGVNDNNLVERVCAGMPLLVARNGAH